MSFRIGSTVTIVQRGVSPMRGCIRSLGTEIQFTSPKIIAVGTKLKLECESAEMQVAVLQYWPDDPPLIRGQVLQTDLAT